jgi:hypothetical protein
MRTEVKTLVSVLVLVLEVELKLCTIRPDSNTTAHIDAFYRSTKLAHDPQIIFTNRTVRTVRKTISQFVWTVRIVYLYSMFYHLHDMIRIRSTVLDNHLISVATSHLQVESRVESLKGRVTSRVDSFQLLIDRVESATSLESSHFFKSSRRIE